MVTERERAAAPAASRIRQVQFGCLLAALLMTLVFFLTEDRASGVAFLLAERYMALPAMTFFGASVCQQLPRQNRRALYAGLAMIVLFFATQLAHQVLEADGKQVGTFVCAYALCFPFAAATEDETDQKGLKWMAALFLTAGLLLTVYTALLFLNALPEYLKNYVYWDGSRLFAMGHPNICATLLMISMAFCAGFALQSQKCWVKIGLGALMLPQFFALSLTNGRTTIILTCLLLGGIVFCAMRGRDWKRTLAALLAAVIVMAVAFGVSRAVYGWNQSRLIAALTEAQTAEEPMASAETQTAEEAMAPSAAQIVEEPVVLVGEQGQGTLANDMKTLNGRTLIWKNALQKLEENPRIKFIGTEYVDMILSREFAFPLYHTHNSWLEALYRMGLPGLAAALALTVLALWSAAVVLWRNADLWKSCIALLSLCLLGCAMLEPYLFVVDISYFYLDFLFLTCLGYLSQWRKDTGDSGNV